VHVDNAALPLDDSSALRPATTAPGRHHVVEDLAVHTRRAAGDPPVVGGGTRQGPLVQAVPAVAEPVARSLIGPRDEPSSDMDR
jgi:hypothetical protein